MSNYEEHTRKELERWKKQMLRNPSIISIISKSMQTKINSWIPERVHVAVTNALKQMIRAVLFGASYTALKPPPEQDMEVIEAAVLNRIETYRNAAAIEGGITGAGGFLLGLADFPILIGIKIKLLFDIASLFGFNVKDYKERVYILHIFELTFSSDAHRRKVFLKMTNWEQKSRDLPDDINQFDWRNFQQEYRDYIDLAKMAQMIPLIGAPIGAFVNYRMLRKLGVMAINAYRMRLERKLGMDL